MARAFPPALPGLLLLDGEGPVTPASATGCPERPPCKGCGCKGGPGYRARDTDRCVGFRELDKICGTRPARTATSRTRRAQAPTENVRWFRASAPAQRYESLSRIEWDEPQHPAGHATARDELGPKRGPRVRKKLGPHRATASPAADAPMTQPGR